MKARKRSVSRGPKILEGGTDLDYDEEARKLFEAVNLGLEGAPSRYSPCDPLWKHPQTGATLYVGGIAIAEKRDDLAKLNITRIVNCQEKSSRNFFAKDAELKYLRFHIGLWRNVVDIKKKPAVVWEFFDPFFSFVTTSLLEGRNVLVHCAAGAHRAGTAGISCLMMFCGWGPADAIVAAKKLRPAIDPIGGFPDLLDLLERSRAGREKSIQLYAEAPAEVTEAEVQAETPQHPDQPDQIDKQDQQDQQEQAGVAPEDQAGVADQEGSQ